MNRYEFLKSMGFKGAALMAVLTSCVNEEDTYVEAEAVSLDNVRVEPQAQQTAPGTKPPKGQQGGATTLDNSKVTGTSTVVSTADLNAIKSPLLKLDLAASATANLKTLGGFIIQSNIVVAQVSANSYAAVTIKCIF